MHEFSSAACLKFLEGLTGITGLIPDPYFEGGGLHQIEPGGYLKVHADFNWHKTLRLDRRINLGGGRARHRSLDRKRDRLGLDGAGGGHLVQLLRSC